MTIKNSSYSEENIVYSPNNSYKLSSAVCMSWIFSQFTRNVTITQTLKFLLFFSGGMNSLEITKKISYGSIRAKNFGLMEEFGVYYHISHITRLNAKT